MPQIYEVTAIVAAHRTVEWESYMSVIHIPEVLATGCFAAAFFAKDENRYTIAYHVNTPEDLDRYVTEYAVPLRADVLDKFGNDVELSRRTLDIVKLFPGG